MGKKLFLCSVLVLLVVAAADRLVCAAEGDPLASPTPHPAEPVAAPVIFGVNPEIVKPEGEEGEITPSGGLPLQDLSSLNRMGLPAFLEVVPQDPVSSEVGEGHLLVSLNETASFPDFQVQGENPAASWEDPALPWMGLFSGIAALALTFMRAGEWSGSGTPLRLFPTMANPQTQIARRSPGSYRNQFPSREQGWVQVGLRGVKLKVPVYETKRVRAGFKKEVRQVPVYKIKKVYSGTRLVAKKVPVTRYRIKKVWTWKKTTRQVPIVRRIGSKRITLGYKEQNRWKRIQVEKRIPYQAAKTIYIEEPIYQTKKVRSGTRMVTRWVPNYQEKKVLVGYKTMERTIPIFQYISGQAGNLSNPQEGGQDEFDLSEKERRLKETLIQAPVPEAELASLLQKGIGSVWPRESNGSPKSWLYRTIVFFQNCRNIIVRIASKLGAPVPEGEGPHLVSVSTSKEAPLALYSAESLTPHTFLPPHFLDLFFTRQELYLGPKVETTIYPEGLMNLNLTRRSWSMQFGKTTLFVTMNGEVGFGKRIGSTNTVYDQTNQKYSLHFGSDGISYQSKLEGVILYKEQSRGIVEIKEIRTLKSQITTIRILGILVGVLALALTAALLYLVFNAGIPLPTPSELIL